MGWYFQVRSCLRWASSLAVSVFLAGLLLATACSADCLGLQCASPSPAQRQRPQNADAHAHHEGAPEKGPSAPAGSGDCSGHGLSLVFDRAPGKALPEKGHVAAPAVAPAADHGVLLPLTGYSDFPSDVALPLAPSRSAPVLRI
jgi:hypothetical protein